MSEYSITQLYQHEITKDYQLRFGVKKKKARFICALFESELDAQAYIKLKSRMNRDAMAEE